MVAFVVKGWGDQGEPPYRGFPTSGVVRAVARIPESIRHRLAPPEGAGFTDTWRLAAGASHLGEPDPGKK
jgi:hypothetical protein